MKEVYTMDPFEAIRKRPQLYFGKDDVNGFDLLQRVMYDLPRIDGFRCAIYDEDLFVVYSDKDWISEHYKNYEYFLKTVSSLNESLDPFINYGALVFACSNIVAMAKNGHMLNMKGHLPVDRIDSFIKKYNLTEEGFYFIFSV